MLKIGKLTPVMKFFFHMKPEKALPWLLHENWQAGMGCGYARSELEMCIMHADNLSILGRHPFKQIV